ncbi:hypothetical protein ACLMJK_005265 [Lecanora helva]
MPRRKASTPPNFLLKITLCKTIDPTVTRLLSIPADLQFAELHHAIAAAFGWSADITRRGIWLFRRWNDDPVKHCNNRKHVSSFVVYATVPDSNIDLDPPNLNTNVKILDHLSKEKSGKFWTYEYNFARIHHAIEVVDSINDDQIGKLGCLGGHGQIERTAWQFADLAGADGVTRAGKSTWDLDMKALNARLAVVQASFDRRKEEENEKRARKGRPRAKETMPSNTPREEENVKNAKNAKTDAKQTKSSNTSKEDENVKRAEQAEPHARQTKSSNTPIISNKQSSKPSRLNALSQLNKLRPKPILQAREELKPTPQRTPNVPAKIPESRKRAANDQDGTEQTKKAKIIKNDSDEDQKDLKILEIRAI